MDGLTTGGRGRLAVSLAVLACLVAPAGTSASEALDGADAAAALGGDSRWISVALLGGWTQLDPRLADYQWDVRPQAAWGAQALAGSGRFAAGGRLWRTNTTQQLAVSGGGPTVHATSWELVGQGRIATIWGTRLLACGSVGRLHIGYEPDRMTFDPGTGSPVLVEFDPIDEWIAGGGLAVERPLAGPWSASLQLDGQVFGLEAAHRNGDAIEVGRESFGDWSARASLAWSTGRR